MKTMNYRFHFLYYPLFKKSTCRSRNAFTANISFCCLLRIFPRWLWK